MRRKGQAAMEFLMTYGWAILVVLIAIGALAYFGVLSPERFLPEKCVIATGSGLYCDDYTADGTAQTVTIRVKNLLTETVNITSISLDTSGEDCDTLIPTADGALVTAENTTDFDVTCTTLVSGDKVKADMIITFHEEGVTPGLDKTASGQLVTTAA